MNSSVAVITGGTSGFGLEVAKMLANAGASVVICGRSREKGETAMAELKAIFDKVVFVAADTTKEPEVLNLFETAKREFGKVTHVFANAGVLNDGDFVNDDDFSAAQSMIDVNITGTTLTARHGFRAIVETASKDETCAFVFTSSVGGSMGNGCSEIFPGHGTGNNVFSIYTSTKAYIDSLARGCTGYHSEHGIRVYTISPSVYSTGMGDPESADQVGSIVNPLIKDYSGDAKDVASVVVSMFDGSTAWVSGDNVGCEGPFTYDVHERYKLMYEKKNFGVASPAIPFESLKDQKGAPVSVSHEDIEKIHDTYKASKVQKA